MDFQDGSFQLCLMELVSGLLVVYFLFSMKKIKAQLAFGLLLLAIGFLAFAIGVTLIAANPDSYYAPVFGNVIGIPAIVCGIFLTVRSFK